MISINMIPVLRNNYAYLITDTSTNKTMIIDPSEANPIISYLSKNNIKLDYILNTHHHWDHSGGNIALKTATGAKILSPAHNAYRIRGMDISIDGDEYFLGNSLIKLVDIPGHTKNDLAIYFPNSSTVFTGDILFSGSIGPIFECDFFTMYKTVYRLMLFPDDTIIYPAHEYTIKHLVTDLYLEENNQNLYDYFISCQKLRKELKPTLPTTLALEKKINPFFRLCNRDIRKKIGEIYEIGNYIYEVDDFEIFKFLRNSRFLTQCFEKQVKILRSKGVWKI